MPPTCRWHCCLQMPSRRSALGRAMSIVHIEPHDLNSTATVSRRTPSRDRRHPLGINERVAIAGVLVAVVAAVPAYLALFADGSKSSPSPKPPVAAVARGHTGQIVANKHGVLIADLTRGSQFHDPLRASPCDELEYRARLYNPGPGNLTLVRVAADINTIRRYTTMIPTIVVYTPDGAISETAFQSRIVVPVAQTQEYVAESTQILDNAGRVARTSAGKQLADGVTASGNGISIGTVNVGVTEYFAFRTRLSCYRSGS